MRNPLLLLLLTTLTINAAAGDPVSLRRRTPAPATGVTYTLRDDYTDTLAAGSVNGTSATPGPGTRTVTDSDSTLTIGSGYANFALNSPTAWGDNLLTYGSTARAAGKLVYYKLALTNAFDGQVGLMANTTAPGSYNDTDFESTLRFAETATTAYWDYDTIDKSIGVYSTSDTDYVMALRANGAFLFVGGKLRYIAYDNSTSTLYPSANNAGKGFRVDSVRIPSGVTWLPTPTASDGFGSAGALSTTDGLGHAETSGVGAGGGSVTWTGGFYSSGSAAYATNITTYADMVTNGDMETGDPPSSWTAGTSTTLDAETSDIYAGSQSLKIANNGTTSPFAYQSITVTNGQWFKVGCYQKNGTSQYTRIMLMSQWFSPNKSDSTYTFLKAAWRSTTTSFRIDFYALNAANSGDYVLFDNVTVIPLLFSDMIHTLNCASAYSYSGVGYTYEASNWGMVGGLIGNLDSTSSPANFWILYKMGDAIYLDQYVAGVCSNLIDISANYSAGARIEAITYLDGSDMKIRVYYNKAYVNGATLNAALKTNTKFGIFSTDDSLRFDNFVVYPTGESGEHSATLNKY